MQDYLYYQQNYDNYRDYSQCRNYPVDIRLEKPAEKKYYKAVSYTHLKEPGNEDVNIKITPAQLTAMLSLVEQGVVSLVAVQKEIFPKVWGTDSDPAAVVDKLGLRQSNDTAEIEAVVKEIMAANERVVNDYRSGNTKVVSFFVGQVMKATKGKANPKVVNDCLLYTSRCV